MTPAEFGARCRVIVATQRGHEAHRSLDLLTNEVLRELGFGEGVGTFEAAVAGWHEAADPYPYRGPCPNCEAPIRPRSPEKRGELKRLYLEGVRLQEIAEEIGGTVAGVRSTVRKMRDRGELPDRPRPLRRFGP